MNIAIRIIQVGGLIVCAYAASLIKLHICCEIGHIKLITVTTALHCLRPCRVRPSQTQELRWL